MARWAARDAVFRARTKTQTASVHAEAAYAHPVELGVKALGLRAVAPGAAQRTALQENRCPDYENRPQICRDFPDNPISFLPKACGFSKWKEEVEPLALKLRATLEIADFYKNKLAQ